MTTGPNDPPAGRSRYVCPQCTDNMVSLADLQFHCPRCKALWTVESTASSEATLVVKP